MLVGPEFIRRLNLPPIIIIGSGPAGMSLAVSLAEMQIDSLVLEGGGYDYSDKSQELYGGETFGDPYFDLDTCRLRYLGGSSNHWGGYCRPLDAADFEARPDLNVHGWPISKTDLDPYDARTRDILEVGETKDHALTNALSQVEISSTPAVSFGDKYAETIKTSNRIYVALNTSVVSLAAKDGKITAVRVRDANEGEFELAPKFVVVACGGIENSRLLLWSNRQSPEPVAPYSDALGRYWMEHPHFTVGETMLHKPINNAPDSDSIFAVAPPAENLRKYAALSGAVRLTEYQAPDGASGQLRLLKCNTAPRSVDILNRAAGTNFICGGEARIAWEQAPDIDNRVALSDGQMDRYGIPQPELHWRKTETDYRTAKVVFELVGRELVRNGIGLARAFPHLIEKGGYPDDDELAGFHHMGGTRMSASPSEGVVDGNLRIHGIENGYVAGSSVFVRGGHANPTFTIVQLSLRLAEHLQHKIGN